MKKVCIFLFLLFNCSESMNISCVSSTYSGNNTSFYETCNVSASVGGKLLMLCNMSGSSIECTSIADSGQTSVLQRIFNVGSTFGWLWLGGRAVYKWLRSSPREDYMRGRFQRILSSELLGFLITVPSIISIFTDASWGNYLTNVGPLLFGAIIQFPYDVFKIVRSRKREQRFNSFKVFMSRLDNDINTWNGLNEQDVNTLDDDEQEKLLKAKNELKNRLDIRLLEWAHAEFNEINKGNLNPDTVVRYSAILTSFSEILSSRLKNL